MRKRTVVALACALGLSFAAATLAHDAGATKSTSRPKPHAESRGKHAHFVKRQLGKLSWYGVKWKGRKTASGEPFDPYEMTMAHKTLPLGTCVEVTNFENGHTVKLRINDRGPYVLGRIADVTQAAADKLGMRRDGVVDGELKVSSWAGKERIC